MSIHDRFDLASWIREFPLDRLRSEAEAFVAQRQRAFPDRYPSAASVDDHIRLMYPRGEIAVGPKSVAVNEQLRAEAGGARADAGASAATDVVVWSRGEAADRAITKIGGRPYRSATSPWPIGPDGFELRFVGQLCFADSSDLVPGLPADVLLIFGDDDALIAEPDRLVFEWVRLGIEDLVDQLPQREDRLTPFHGVLHRTHDWPDAEELFAAYRRGDILAVWEGTKLGGVPHYIQGDENPVGRFIGALGSIAVPEDDRYPFVNVPEPRGRSGDNDLMIGDMGSLYLFLFPDGRVRGVPQCY